MREKVRFFPLKQTSFVTNILDKKVLNKFVFQHDSFQTLEKSFSDSFSMKNFLLISWVVSENCQKYVSNL